MNVCIKEGCDKPVRVALRGLCNTHYVQWQRQQPSNKACSISGCQEKFYAGGYCSRHYELNRRNGAPVKKSDLPRPECSVENCKTVSFSRGWCLSHYNKQWRENHAGTGLDTSRLHDDVGYATMHVRLWRAFGPARWYPCCEPECDKQAEEWSVDASSPELRMDQTYTGFTQVYSTRLADFRPRCRHHHAQHDRDNGLQRAKRGPKGPWKNREAA